MIKRSVLTVLALAIAAGVAWWTVVHRADPANDSEQPMSAALAPELQNTPATQAHDEFKEAPIAASFAVDERNEATQSSPSSSLARIDASAKDDLERAYLIGAHNTVCQVMIPEVTPDLGSPDAEQALKANRDILERYRSRFCNDPDASVIDRLNELMAVANPRVPEFATIDALRTDLGIDPNNQATIAKLEQAMDEASSPEAKEQAAGALIDLAPKRWAFSKYVAHLQLSDTRSSELQRAALALSGCKRRGACGNGQLGYLQVCAADSRCRAGESLDGYYRRVFSSDEYQAVQTLVRAFDSGCKSVTGSSASSNRTGC